MKTQRLEVFMEPQRRKRFRICHRDTETQSLRKNFCSLWFCGYYSMIKFFLSCPRKWASMSVRMDSRLRGNDSVFQDRLLKKLDHRV